MTKILDSKSLENIDIDMFVELLKVFKKYGFTKGFTKIYNIPSDPQLISPQAREQLISVIKKLN